jgi:hypothetical protein
MKAVIDHQTGIAGGNITSIMPEVICGDKTGGNLASIVRKPAT